MIYLALIYSLSLLGYVFLIRTIRKGDSSGRNK